MSTRTADHPADGPVARPHSSVLSGSTLSTFASAPAAVDGGTVTQLATGSSVELAEILSDTGDGNRAVVTAASEAPAALSRGQRDPGRYEVDGEHGRGGLGRVMRAQDRDLGRAVAIKELLRRDPIGEVRFFREAMITARLEHPGIVPVHEAGRWPDGTPFYTMKLVDGRPFKALIEAASGFAGRLALLPHVAAVADAIGYAHERRIIHRDLKPSNVIVGNSVDIEWGVAKEVGSADGEPDGAAGPFRRSGGGDLTATGAVLGTPAYMPLEQARGADVDERADVYAIGAILYALLAGRPPYPGAQERALRAILAAPPPPVEQLEPQVPPDLAAIVSRAMARDAADRYPTARGLAEDLKRFLTGQLVSAHRYRPRQLLRRWAARHRAALAVAAVAAAAIAVGASLAIQQIIAKRDTAERERDIARQERAAAADARAIAEGRANEMILTTAERYLGEDPTRTLSLLSEYPDSGADWGRVARIAATAVSNGVAAQVVDTGDPSASRVAYSADGAYLAVAGARALLVWRTSDWQLVVEERTGEAGHDASYLVAAAGRPLFVSVHGGGEVRLADAVTGVVRHLRAPVELTGVVVDAQGTAVTALGADGSLRRWPLADGALRTIAAHRRLANELVPSADGRSLLSVGFDGRALLWDAALPDDHPVEERRLPGVGLRLGAISADGTRLAASDDGHRIWVWDRRRPRGSRPMQLRSEGVANHLVFSADGTQLMASCLDDVVRRWELTTRTVSSQEGGVILALGAEDTVAAGASDGAVRLLDPATRWQRTLRGHRDRVQWIAVAADGDVASIATGGELRVWSRRLRPSGIVRAAGLVYAARFSADGRTLTAADSTGGIWVRDLRDGVTTRRVGHRGGDVIRPFGAGGLVAGSLAEGGIRVWRPGAEVLDVPGIAATSQIAVVANGAQLFAGGRSGELRRIDGVSGEVEVLRRYSGPVRSIGADPSGRWIAVGAADGSIDLYDRERSRFAAHRQLEGLQGLVILADASLVALDGQRQLHVWSATGEERAETAPLPGIDDGSRLVPGLRGRWFASVSDTGETVIHGDGGAQTGPIETGSGHADAALDEGHALAVVGGSRGLVTLRDLDVGAEVLLSVGQRVIDLDLAPRGEWLSATAGDHVLIWQLDDELRPPTSPSELQRWLRARPKLTGTR